MASATGIPERRYSDIESDGAEQRETEPLLGRPGDAAQEDGVPMFRNLVLGRLIPSFYTPRPLGANIHRV